MKQLPNINKPMVVCLVLFVTFYGLGMLFEQLEFMGMIGAAAAMFLYCIMLSIKNIISFFTGKEMFWKRIAEYNDRYHRLYILCVSLVMLLFSTIFLFVIFRDTFTKLFM
ncbi:hypothetical protein [Photobacterium kasasachensis]|uniref:hypothetical protein n=1 Tax=Photobacterium kasasachensis TaxID=2910240 RepID=UPI003D11EE9F